MTNIKNAQETEYIRKEVFGMEMESDKNSIPEEELDERDKLNGDDELVLPINIEKKILWQAKDFSIREFDIMFKEGSLNLRPDYQRNFVMDIKLSSKLVESILMDVPIPVIYLAEEDDEIYSVIDGQQRLTTFISFLNGKFPDDKNFELVNLKVLTNLNKLKFCDLNKSSQSKIKTTTLHTIIIKKESSEDIKFEIFERLNTGSIKLNEDEIRNTIYRGEYIRLLAELENNETFSKMVNRENFKRRMQYRGMILRFFALSEKTYLNYKPSMKQFCNKELRDNKNLADEKKKEYREKFKKVVDITYTVFGEKAFRRFNPGDENDANGKWNISSLNMALFDIELCGFVNYEKYQIVPKADAIREALIQLMSENEKFIDSIEIATNDRQKVKKRFMIWFETLERIVGNPSNEIRIFPFSVKKKLFNEDQTCKLCEQQITDIDDAEVDHIIPYSEGGKTIIENAQLTHRYCNRKKNNKMQVLDDIRESERYIDIFANYLNQEITAKFSPSSGSIKYKGNLYESPSSAGNKAKIDLGAHDKISTNGWQFWKYIDEKTQQEFFIDNLRQ
jgi:hypothetical protein